MPSVESPFEAHLSVRALIRLALAGETHPHLATCTGDCKKHYSGFRWGAGEIRALHTEVTQPKRRKGEDGVALVSLHRAVEISRKILEAAEHDELEADLVLMTYRDDPALVPGLLHACQNAARLVMKDPKAADEFGELAKQWAVSKEDRISKTQFESIRIEALLVRSQAALQQGRGADAARLSGKALERAFRNDRVHESTIARSTYYHASALGATGESERAIVMLENAKATFSEYEMQSWVGKAEAAIGLALLYKGPDPKALERFAVALTLLDPELDGHNISSIQMNRGALQLLLGRNAEARESYLAAIDSGMRAGATAIVLAARVNLLSLAIEEGRYSEVLTRGPRVLENAESEFLSEHVFFTLLFLAEASFAVGSTRSGESYARRALASVPASHRSDDVLARLMARMDGSNVDDITRLDALRKIREHFDGKDEAQASAQA